jgi:hypothetical protein
MEALSSSPAHGDLPDTRFQPTANARPDGRQAVPLNVFQARFDFRGYTTFGSVNTFTNAGTLASSALSSAGRSSPGVLTSSP